MKKYCLITLVIFVMTVIVSCAAPSASPSPTPAPTPAPAPAQPAPITLKFAYHTPPNSYTTINLHDAWAKKVEEATKGRVKVVSYPAESLVKSNNSYEATIGGITDINWLVQGFFPGKFSLSYIITLPFMCLTAGKVEGRTVSAAEINSRIFMELYEMFPEIQKEYAEVKVLFLHTSSPSFLITTKKAVDSLEGFKGLKVRSLAGPPSDMWKALGSVPVLLPAPEAYDSLSKGVIDGMETTWGQVGSNKLYDPCKYWTNMAAANSMLGMIMNLNKWNSLPADIQTAIMSVSGMRGAEFIGQGVFSEKEKTEIVAQMKKDNKTMEQVNLLPGEYEKIVAVAGQPGWDKWVAENEAKGLPAKKVLTAALALLDKYRVR